mgnify:CR=1 FL=1
MKSDLEGRNNEGIFSGLKPGRRVSMKSGLEGRNNELVFEKTGQTYKSQ